MKKTVFLLLLVGAAFIKINAQTSYSFSVASAPYATLSGGVSFHSTLPDTIIKTGFPIEINGITNDTLFLRLPFAQINTSNSSSYSLGLQSFGAEQLNGTHEYLISGPVGNQILKLQFSNIKFSHDYTGLDFINYQVWYYESDKSIEIHFGPSSVTNPQSYFVVGVGVKNGAAIGFNNLWLTGSPSSPVTTTLYGSTLNGTPPSGTIYKFGVSPTNLPDNVANTKCQSLIYPNPASDILYFTEDVFNYDYVISDITGKIWLKGHTKASPLNISSLAKGNYLIKLINEKKNIATQYFIKQ